MIANEQQDGPLAVSISEAARLLGLSERKVWELKATGELPCRRVGRRVLVPVEALRAFLSGGKDSATG
jgi:excisionase family DNA binding protein